MNDPHFEDHYRRMDPIAAKKLRELKLPGMFKDEVTPAGDGEHYSEVRLTKAVLFIWRTQPITNHGNSLRSTAYSREKSPT